MKRKCIWEELLQSNFSLILHCFKLNSFLIVTSGDGPDDNGAEQGRDYTSYAHLRSYKLFFIFVIFFTELNFNNHCYHPQREFKFLQRIYIIVGINIL